MGITFDEERGEIDAVAMLGCASCWAGFLVGRINKVKLLATVHPWAPLQGFQGHPLVKGDYQAEEVMVMGGDFRNGRDPGISRAAAAGATNSTSTWCSADSAKPVHLGLTRQKDV